jgi:replicative DNA helicase
MHQVYIGRNMIQQPVREYENKFLEILQEYPKYCVASLGYLNPGDIKDELIRSVWERAVAGIGKNTDDYDCSVLVSDAVIKTGILEKGNYYNSPLEDVTPESVVSKIQEMAYARRVDYLNGEIVNANRQNDLAKVALLIERLKDEKMGTDGGMKSAEDVGADFVDRIESGNLAIPWYIGGLDRATGGKEKETLLVIAARPGMGKTALMLQAARNDSKKYKVGVFELEMGAVSLWARIACPAVGVDWKDVISGDIKPDKKLELIAASKKMASQHKNLYIDATPGLSASDIYQKAVQNSLDIVYIDHLGIMGGDENEKEVKRLGVITMKLKNMAKTLGIPVVLAVQLNRNVDSRKNKVPVLADLRDSGEIEQNADDVLMIYRESYYVPNGDNTTEIWLRKFRNGEANAMVELSFDKKQQWFDSAQKVVIGEGYSGKAQSDAAEDYTV